MPSYVVVGGSRGIGLELVRQLSENAENTVITLVRNKTKSIHLENVLERRTNIHVLEADVIDAAVMKAVAVETSKITGGGLDFLVHSAARMETENLYKSFADYASDEELDTEFITSFRVNTLGIIHSINAFLPLLRQCSTKKIVVISSSGGSGLGMSFPGMASYGTTRAGSNMVVAKYAVLLEKEGFFVAGFSPGLVDTSATSENPEQPDQYFLEYAAEFSKRIPGFRALTPLESVEKLLKQFDSVGPEGNGKLHMLPM